MNIIKSALTKVEKKNLRKRMVLLNVIVFFILIPVLLFLSNCIGSAIQNIMDNVFSLSDGIANTFALALVYLITKYVWPFYKEAVHDLTRTEKFIIRTRIIQIEAEFILERGYRYTIFTDMPGQIISTHAILIGRNVTFANLKANMDIIIHSMDKKAKRILSIETMSNG